MFISDEVLRIIHLVAKYQSITVAAEHINKVPSALSYTIKKLENSFGFELFIRRGRNIKLTPMGEYFIRHSKSIMNDIDSLCRNTALIHNGVEQTLTIAVNNIVDKKLISEFIAEFEIVFYCTQLIVNTEIYNGCWDAIYHKRADVVIGAPHSVPSSDGIISEHVGYMEWDFVVGPQHCLATHMHPLENRELRQYTAVRIRDTGIHFIPLCGWHLEGQKALFVPDLDIAISLIQKNIAIGYIPHYLAKPLLNNGTLVKKSILEHKHATQLFIAAKTDGLGEAGRWCLEYWLRPEVKTMLNGW